MVMRSARPTCLVGFLKCQLSKTTARGQTRRHTRTHYPDSEPTSLCSFSLMLRASRRSNKYEFHSLWFDPLGFEPSICHTRGSTLTITPSMRFEIYFIGCKTIEFSIIQRENTFVVPTRVTCLEAFSSGVPPVVFTASSSINHLYSHKPYTTVQRRHKYTYNTYRIDINIYTVYTTKTWV